jgi:uncharacterized protein (TIGR01777 family)
MTFVFTLLIVQCLLGALDTFWNHEWKERLPQRRGARVELALHSLREFIYVFVFLALAWREWHGIWVACIAVPLLAEVAITAIDFVIEDRTRVLRAFERVLHTVLTVLFGVFLMALAPVLVVWAREPAAVVPASYPFFSTVFTWLAAGMLLWALRDGIAALGHFRLPEWLRHPIEAAPRASGRNVLVTGATGFIGGHVVRRLRRRGDTIWVWTRDADRALARFGPHVHVVTRLGDIPVDARIDAVVNLAGAPIFGLPWTRARRRTLIASRVGTTQALIDWFAKLGRLPRVLVNASAIGYYGVGGDEWLDEGNGTTQEFQSLLCREWEDTAQAAEALGLRVVRLRIGLVLGGDGGLLPRLLLPARLGLASVLGDGRQWQSWIHVADLARVVEFALAETSLRGPVNAVAPAPVRQREFQRALAQAAARPQWLTTPAAPLRLLLGEMATLLVDGQRVAPRKLLAADFEFRHVTLQAALRDLVAAPATRRVAAVGDAGCEVYFNGDCPVCSREIGAYARHADKRALPLRFTDSMRTPEALREFGLRIEHLERRLYLRDEQGRVISGFRAVIALWARMPRYRVLAHVFGFPPLRAACEFLYDHAVAPSLARWGRARAGRPQYQSK